VALVRRLLQAGPGEANPYTTRLLRQAFLGARTETGKTVTVERALQFDVVWACIRFRAWSIGQLPLLAYERLGDHERRRARDFPTARILRRPNVEQSGFQAWGLASTHLNSWGNVYLGKAFHPMSGRVRALWPIHPELVRVGREGGQKVFYIRDAESGIEDPEPYTTAEIIHIWAFSLDGLTGLSPVGMGREAIAAGLSRDQFAHRLHKDGAIPFGILSTDQELSDDAAERLERRFNRKHRGSRNSRRTAVLERGLKYQALTLPPADSEFIKTEELGIAKICRWFNVSPTMVFGHSGDSMEYKTVEGEALRTLVFNLGPELACIEQGLEGDHDLFPRRPGDVESRWFPEFLADAMLRADTLSRYRAYSVATGGRAWAWPSEIRPKEGLPPDDRIDDPELNPPRGSSLAEGGGDRSAPTDQP
jgi:HK97 family phage portal protein